MGIGISSNYYTAPNEAIDRFMELLLPTENVILQFATRHILGWNSKADSMRGKISLSVFEKGFTTKDGKRFGGCGLTHTTIQNKLKDLHEFGVLIKIGEVTQDGQEWELPYNNMERVRWDKLEARRTAALNKNQGRVKKATAASIEKRKGIPSNGIPDQSKNDPQVYRPTVQESTVQRNTGVPSNGHIQIHIKTLKTVDTREGDSEHPIEPPQTPKVDTPEKVEEPINVFKHYSDNIGQISQHMADLLREAEKDYPAQWIIDAINEAVEHNARKWAYVDKILSTWNANGRKDKPKAGTNSNGSLPAAPAPRTFDPNCPKCHGMGAFKAANVTDEKHPLFGKAIPCSNCQPDAHKRFLDQYREVLNVKR